jgi:hypothetical protein
MPRARAALRATGVDAPGRPTFGRRRFYYDTATRRVHAHETTALIHPARRKSSCMAFMKSGDEREQTVWDVQERGESFGRLPAHSGRARRGVHEHERQIEAEREMQSAARERDV